MSWKTQAGYVKVYVRGRGKIFEHRLVVEKAIGRRLEPTEVIHHINGIKDDNRLENLQILSNSEHAKITFAMKHCSTCTCYKRAE